MKPVNKKTLLEGDIFSLKVTLRNTLTKLCEVIKRE